MCAPDGSYICKNGGICEYDDMLEEISCLCPYSHEGKYCEEGMFLVSLNIISVILGFLTK